MFNAPQQKIASANIRAGRILALGTTENKVAEATGVTIPFAGISANRNKFPVGSYEDTAFPYCALTNEAVPYAGSDGMEADCVCGAAITDLRLPLTSDGLGRAITASLATVGAGYYVGFPINVTAAANEIVRVRIQLGVTNIGAS